ncbi:hypothetical protein CROQUDRAFT_655368 [Cronartium quercuum f. sp. fusiforme G11]|uniref:Uncharacterized protein n=1 Tax=Cronartium quercuum f. sp. fusiforme G11 TaxID=708437 RepID=A0A9P6TD54_9BASI|nr:hypothetical protein CROQUDRAFT_655368 [Cronartium quercuum f. sp. fusiforme G11]
MKYLCGILILLVLGSSVKTAFVCPKPDTTKDRIEPSDCQSALMGFDRFFTGTIHYDQHVNRKSCQSCQIVLRASDGKYLHA